MLNLNEAQILLNFLDRVPLKGHQEREDMNLVVSKVVREGNTKPQGVDQNANS